MRIVFILYSENVTEKVSQASDIEIEVDELVLTAVINPYFLRLSFSDPLVEDDRSSAVYDPASGYLTVTLSKVTKGQHFKDLDLLSKLLAPRPASPQPLVEVLDSNDDLVEKVESLSIEDDIYTKGVFYGVHQLSLELKAVL